MGKKRGADTQVLLDRAETEPRERVEKLEPERRYVYGGESPSRSSGFPLHLNRKSTRRKTSTFNIILILFACGVAIVLYVNNIIVVNQLAYEVDQLQLKYNKIMNTNAGLRAEINRKSSWERIGAMATEQLGLKYPREQPTWFDVDEEKEENVESIDER